MKKIVYIVIAIILLASLFYYFRKERGLAQEGDRADSEQQVVIMTPQDRRELVEVVKGSTFGQLMSSVGIDANLSNLIYKAALAKYDLAKVKIGHTIELSFDKDDNKFKKLVYKIDSENELAVDYVPAQTTSTEEIRNDFKIEIRPIDYEIRVVTKEGVVESSMYEAAIKNNIDERAIVELANAFQWTIDFAMDPRVGDTFRFVYEERYLNGEYQMPGRILAGQYINEGKKYQVYNYNDAYYDENGNSAQKMFLRAPVSFKYISSGFTTGARYIEAFDISTGHRAIDYAAQSGTPIRAVGDGVVTMAQYNGSYGNMVKIRHNSTYQTNYGHMSRFAVRKGARVSQGDIIGYVGSTGLSTGPHLHYEMEKNGVKINPLKEAQPQGESIKVVDLENYMKEIGGWRSELNK